LEYLDKQYNQQGLFYTNVGIIDLNTVTCFDLPAIFTDTIKGCEKILKTIFMGFNGIYDEAGPNGRAV